MRFWGNKTIMKVKLLYTRQRNLLVKLLLHVAKEFYQEMDIYIYFFSKMYSHVAKLSTVRVFIGSNWKPISLLNVKCLSVLWYWWLCKWLLPDFKSNLNMLLRLIKSMKKLPNFWNEHFKSVMEKEWNFIDQTIIVIFILK